jgi:hypothetical protein
VQIRLGGQTDIGGGRENQDMWFGWADPGNSGTTVFGVLDGHGREVGRVAAMAGRDAIMDWLEVRIYCQDRQPLGPVCEHWKNDEDDEDKSHPACSLVFASVCCCCQLALDVYSNFLLFLYINLSLFCAILTVP